MTYYHVQSEGNCCSKCSLAAAPLSAPTISDLYIVVSGNCEKFNLLVVNRALLLTINDGEDPCVLGEFNYKIEASLEKSLCSKCFLSVLVPLLFNWWILLGPSTSQALPPGWVTSLNYHFYLKFLITANDWLFFSQKLLLTANETFSIVPDTCNVTTVLRDISETSLCAFCGSRFWPRQKVFACDRWIVSQGFFLPQLFF